MYNEPDTVITKDDDEGPNDGSREVGQEIFDRCTFCAAMDGSKTSMRTSTSRNDAVLIA
jgi:hypothetical protein